MDLSRIDAWTRQMLESEAEKRGVSEPARRSRADLVSLIVRHDYASLRSAGGARRVVGSLVESAVSALPSPWDALARMRTRVSLPGLAKKMQPRWATAPAHSPARAVPQPQDAPVVGVAQRVFERPAVLGGTRPSQPPPSASSRDAATSEPTTLTAATVASAATDAARAPAAAESAVAFTAKPSSTSDTAVTRTFVEEPIRTHSMARLLARQGHRERALAIYEELIAKNSADDTLLQEAEALRQHATPSVAAAELPRPSSSAHDELPAGTDQLECVQRDASGLRLRWSISDAGRARARALLGNAGELTVRVVTIRPDQERVVRSEITEHGPIDAAGEWSTPLVAQGARCFAAVGLRDAQRFVSIVHLQA